MRGAPWRPMLCSLICRPHCRCRANNRWVFFTCGRACCRIRWGLGEVDGWRTRAGGRESQVVGVGLQRRRRRRHYGTDWGLYDLHHSGRRRSSNSFPIFIVMRMMLECYCSCTNGHHMQNYLAFNVMTWTQMLAGRTTASINTGLL